MFNDLLTVTFSTKRLAKDEANHYVFGTEYVLEDKFCALQPASDEQIVGVGSLVQMFKFYTKETNIKVSDKIFAKGKEFTVKSVQNFDYGSEPHLAAIVSEEK